MEALLNDKERLDFPGSDFLCNAVLAFSTCLFKAVWHMR